MNKVTLTKKKRWESGESGEHHLKAKMEDAEAELERAAGQDLCEPDHPPQHGRQHGRAEHGRRRERHVRDEEGHAEHWDSDRAITSGIQHDPKYGTARY